MKKPCHDDPEHVTECYEDDVEKGITGKDECNGLFNFGTWKDCPKGRQWKEPAPPAFEGD